MRCRTTRKTALLLVLASVSLCAQTQPPPPKVTTVVTDTALPLEHRIFHFVAHTQRIEAAAGQPGDATTDWWELRDPNGKVIYRQSYPVKITTNGTAYDFEATESVTAHAFETKLGSGVLVEGGSLPSAPNTGSWVQLFGFRWGPTKAANPTPFGPPISTYGEFLGLATDPRQQQPAMPGRTVFVMNDVLRFRVWTGNFNIVYPVRINWIAGKVEPAWRCLRMSSEGRVDRCRYPVQIDPPPARTERTFVRLFPEPDEQLTPAHIVVEPTSTVEFLQAELSMRWHEDATSIAFGPSPGGDIWLKLRIDEDIDGHKSSHEGWIHTQEDLIAVGLPPAG